MGVGDVDLHPCSSVIISLRFHTVVKHHNWRYIRRFLGFSLLRGNPALTYIQVGPRGTEEGQLWPFGQRCW